MKFCGNGRKCGKWGEEGVGMEEGIRLVLEGFLEFGAIAGIFRIIVESRCCYLLGNLRGTI